MKERPILFSAAMVCALLADRKTQTRRVVKHPLATAAKRILSYHGQTEFDCILPDETGGIIECPYGKPGDQLWVREAFHITKGAQRWPDGTVLYRADHGVSVGGTYVDLAKWKPSIHMPRTASRITLTVTGVRVERLHDISEADAWADGARCIDEVSGREVLFPEASKVGSFKAGYKWLWENINGPGTWAANPWVWVVEFRRVS